MTVKVTRLEQILTEWKATKGMTYGIRPFQKRLVLRQNIMFSLLVYIAKKLG